jgi:tetratricopeptide (TPR) repeat protein
MPKVLALAIFSLFLDVAVATAAPPGATAPVEALPFIEDDYPRALAEARARKLPLFVDSWAPWCHTCRFMRGYVFTDASLTKQAGRFVWLSIDTEKDKNAAFLGKYPIEVFPTLLVVDPARESAVLRWPGSANVAQLVRLLDDGERAVRGGGDEGARARASADRLAGERNWRDASDAYRRALPLLPAADRPRVVESLVFALSASGDELACARTAEELAPSLPRGPSFANAVSLGLTCARHTSGEAGAATRAGLARLAEEAVALPGLLADDRSGIFEELVENRAQVHDEAGRRAIAERWLVFLEGEAARASTVEQRAAFDPHRVNAALALGQPLRAEAALKASEHDLPADYNPPARLALIYRTVKRYDDALAAVDRAIAKAYGPRALRYYDLKAELLVDKGDRAAARKTVEQAIAVAKKLPTEQHKAQWIAQLQQKLEALR